MPFSKSRERISSSNLALGTLCNILPTPEFSPDYRQRRPLVRWRHRLIRLGSTLSALEQALKSEVSATRVSSISSEFPFSKTMAYSRSYHTMAQHCTREGHSCRPLSPRGRALIPVEARSRLDGQRGFRAGMKGRRIKATRYSERRARDTWVGNAGLLSMILT